MREPKPPIEIPRIPREVYRAAMDASDESQEAGDRMACAVEATWVRAWQYATAYAGAHMFVPSEVTEVRDGHEHLIGYQLDRSHERALRAEMGECPNCPCCKGCPGADGHCECECHPRPEYLYGFIAGRNGEFVHHGDEGQARAVAGIVHQPVMRRQVTYGEIEPTEDVATDA